VRAVLARSARVLALVLASACSDPEPREIACGELPRTAAPEGASVVLVVNDTMRRDRIGIYGGPAHTPRFDRFAAEGLWFARAVAQAPWTKPSIATLFTSLYPTQHGVVTHPTGQLRSGEALNRNLRTSDRLPAAAATLAEAYRAAGYRTAAFVANPWLDRRFGFEQGFELYDDSFARWGVRGERVMKAALAWLAELPPEQPYFLYVHTIDTHRPYPALTWSEVRKALEEPPPPGELPPRAKREIASLLRLEGPRPPGVRPPAKRRVVRRAYDKGIERFDAALGLLLDGLAQDPRRDRTGVIVTADHGEALYRRGYGNHGLGLYQSELAVPFAAQLPGAARGLVDCRVGLVDVMPTLCDWSGLECPADMAGRSIFDAVPAEDPGEIYHAEATMLDEDQRAVYQERYKLIYLPGRRPEAEPPPSAWALFDLVADPGEERNLLAEDPRSPEVEAIFATLRAALEHAPSEQGSLEPEHAPLDPELEERLRRLGYLD
jgi:arylsulfatase A-like enzyme